MSLRIDLHVHTRRHSSCSRIEPELLLRQAVKAGLDGLVITEHQYQWSEEDLAALADQAGEPHFLLMAGFECTSSMGDLLIYGLNHTDAKRFFPGMAPEEAARIAQELGGICVAAHPTRANMGFDERIAELPLAAIEVRSVNLRDHEQRLAIQLARNIGVPPVAASDAHQLGDVGRYATEFDYPIQSMADLQESFRRGTFRPAELLTQG